MTIKDYTRNTVDTEKLKSEFPVIYEAVKKESKGKSLKILKLWWQVLLAIVVINFAVLFLGIWLLPYLSISTCEFFFDIFPSISALAMAFSMSYYYNDIQKYMRLKEILAHFEKKEKENRRKEIIRKRMEREIFERENNMLRRN